MDTPILDKVFASLTTCWHLPNKFLQTLDVLNSLPIDFPSILIVNEYPAPMNYETLFSIFRKNYPRHTLLQKTADQKGQAASLNLIMKELEKSGKPYWFHGEESWYLDPIQLYNGAFDMKQFIYIMDTCPLAQLQLTAHWRDLPLDAYVDEEKDYVKEHDLFVIPYPKMLNDLIEDGHEMHNQAKTYGSIGHIWPCFSLLPSIIRSDTVKDLDFPEDLKKWPVKFEYEWSIKWCKGIQHRALKKAVFRNTTYFIRRPGHISTYNH